MRARTPLSQLLDGLRLPLVALAGLALLGGLAEAVVLVAIVHAAMSLSGQSVGSLTVGPLHAGNVSVSILLLVAFVATLLRLVCGLAVAWLGARLTADFQKQLRIEMFHAYVDADWASQCRGREGGLQQTIGLEIDRGAVALLAIATGLAAVCNLVMLLVVALIVNIVGATALVLVCGGLFVLLRPLTRRARRQATSRSNEELGVAQSLNELVRTAEEIRVHGVGEEEKRRLTSEATQVAGWVTRLNFTSLSISHLYQAAALGLIVVALLVVNQIGATSVAGTGAIVLILVRAFAYSQQLQQAFHQMGEGLVSVGVVHDSLQSYRASAAQLGDAPLSTIDLLEFRGVSYSYGRDREAISDFTFTVPCGEVVGVVGPSGAGKSTLVQLLLRLRNPDRGQYLVNGKEASEYADADWARLVSYLPQQPKLIAGTVSDNIRFFRRLGMEEVEEAARMAHLHDEIISWRHGYDTVIGQRSDALSGGQAQRLCLARALVTKPNLLVLDEPTSALDAMSENHVQLALRELRAGTTIFIIAHRLSTLSICDRVMVLRDGQVERMETRERLAAESGFYSEALRISGLT